MNERHLATFFGIWLSTVFLCSVSAALAPPWSTTGPLRQEIDGVDVPRLRSPAREITREQRVALADHLFSARGIAGSKTLRGRIIILLGVPDRLRIVDRTSVARPTSPQIASVFTNAGPLGPGAIQFSVTPVRYVFSYRRSTLPPEFRQEDLTITVELDPVTHR